MEAPPRTPAYQNRAEVWELPRLHQGQRLDLEAIRAPYEKFYLAFVYIPAVVGAIALVVLAFENIEIFLILIAYMALFGVGIWVSWKLFMATVLGHCIRVGPTQYPQIYALVNEASEIIGIETPTVMIIQGHGIFELFVAKRFSRRGLLLITSNMLDDLTENRSSRELMFFIGRQLGLIATGYFKWFTVRHILGQFSTLFYLAWKRRTHITADRIGMLVAGDLYASEQALLIITAGSGVAPSTNLQAVKEQRVELFDSFWGWLNLGLSGYPYMVDRIFRLREFAYHAVRRGIQANEPTSIGALPITHRPIRAIPLMIVHGHDKNSRLALENFLLQRFPHVTPVLMIDQVDAAHTLPEKFERMASEVKGALALLTPDDLAVTLKTNADEMRARQNVIVEIGWFWGRLGRKRCLLLVRGDIEIPSDLSGVEVHRYADSPTECSEVLRDFISSIEVG